MRNSPSATPRHEFLREGHTQPNILFVLTDDLGWSDISLRGAEFDTPNIDDFARESLSLEKHYVGMPYTCLLLDGTTYGRYLRMYPSPSLP